MSPLLPRFGALALAFAMPLAGCSSQGAPSAPAGYLPQTARAAAHPSKGNAPLLYVANLGASSSNSATVNAYNTHGHLARVISDGINAPVALGFDSSREVYVLNTSGGSSSSSSDNNPSVSVYQRGSTSLLRQITRGLTSPVAMTLDANGNVFVANNAQASSSSCTGGNVQVYKAGTTRRIREITDSIAAPRALGTDAAGHLYVLNSGATGSSSSSGSCSSGSNGASITVYKGAGYHLATQITAGLSAPSAMLVDAAGDIFVANMSAGSSASSGNVVEYAAGSTSPTATITNGVDAPRALAMDGSGNLYVLNASSPAGSSSSSSSASGGSVSVYAPGSTSPSYTVVDGINAPDAIAVESSGILFVANTQGSSSSSSSGGPGPSVTEYLPGSTSVRRTITYRIGQPVALGVN